MVRYIDNRCELESNLDSSAQTEIPIFSPESIARQEISIPEDSAFSMARVLENPQVLALEFRDKTAMRYSMARIATYVETLGKARIPTLDESPPAWGHDLKLSDVADFFNACVSLNPEEKELRDQLVAQGLLKPIEIGIYIYTQTIYEPSSPHVLIAIDPDLDSYDRKVTFIHEYSHALYFLDEDFRSQVSEAFSSLDPETQRFLYGAMIASGYYASGEEWLIETETQAHAIEPQGWDHGFLSLMLEAEENCDRLNQPSLACDDFFSYPGDLRGLTTFLHEDYLTISQGRIPLLASKMEEKQNREDAWAFITNPKTQKFFNENTLVQNRNGEITGARQLDPIGAEIHHSRHIHIYTRDDRAKAELGRLQKRFDKSHEGGMSEAMGEPVCSAVKAGDGDPLY